MASAIVCGLTGIGRYEILAKSMNIPFRQYDDTAYSIISMPRKNFCIDDVRLFDKQNQKSKKERFQEDIDKGSELEANPWRRIIDISLTNHSIGGNKLCRGFQKQKGGQRFFSTPRKN